MPVFTDALLGDTLDLSAEEFGAYCLLLFATWRNNGAALPDHDTKLARICRVTPRRWSDRLRPVLVRFFDLSDGRWHQKRLEKEWQFVAQRAAKSRANGALGGRPKTLIIKAIKNQTGYSQGAQTESTHTHTHKEEEVPNGTLSGNGARLPDIAAEMTKIWNEECGSFSRANKPNTSRRGRCARAWRHEFGGNADQWREYCRKVAASPHLRGENDRGWRADLDWVLKPENTSKILEGRYDVRGAAQEMNGHDRPTEPPPSPEELWPELRTTH